MIRPNPKTSAAAVGNGPVPFQVSYGLRGPELDAGGFRQRPPISVTAHRRGCEQVEPGSQDGDRSLVGHDDLRRSQRAVDEARPVELQQRVEALHEEADDVGQGRVAVVGPLGLDRRPFDPRTGQEPTAGIAADGDRRRTPRKPELRPCQLTPVDPCPQPILQGRFVRPPHEQPHVSFGFQLTIVGPVGGTEHSRSLLGDQRVSPLDQRSDVLLAEAHSTRTLAHLRGA